MIRVATLVVPNCSPKISDEAPFEECDQAPVEGFDDDKNEGKNTYIHPMPEDVPQPEFFDEKMGRIGATQGATQEAETSRNPLRVARAG